MRNRMFYFWAIVVFSIIAGFTWNVTARAGYESAQYKVIEKSGNIEIREYPVMMLASTEADSESQGRDGSFMRLFRYISGNNESKQKIEMTVPVFMENGAADSNSKMSFVLPQDVAETGAPKPQGAFVSIRKREGGRFAVIRFSGRMNTDTVTSQESKLRTWLSSRGLQGAVSAESAGYDPPFTPGPLRRNEVLIRLVDDMQAPKPSSSSINN